MYSRRNKPSWWQVYVGLPALVALFLVELRLHLTGTEHVLAQLGILGLIYGFMHVWLRANQRALMGLDEEHKEWRVRVYEFPATSLPRRDLNGNRRAEQPLLHIPDAGLKGVLSTTFEVDDFEEASAFPAGSEIRFSEEVLNRKSTKV